MAKEIIKKINVFTGPAGSGKTKLAREVARNYSDKNVVFMTSYEIDLLRKQYPFSACTSKTELVIIDGIKSLQDFEVWLFKTHRYIHVEKPGKKPFIISPEVILICEPSITTEQLDALGSRISDYCRVYGVEELISPDTEWAKLSILKEKRSHISNLKL